MLVSDQSDDLTLVEASACRRDRLPLPSQAEVSPGMRQLWDYWNRCRGDRFAPTRAEIVPADIKAILRSILLIDVVGPPEHFVYRLTGTAADAVHGHALTGKSILAQKPEAFAALLLKDMQRLVEDRTPQRVAFDFDYGKGERRHYEVLRLPLSEDGENVDRLLCFADYQADDGGPPALSPR